jgi:hypothetical protein
LPNICEPITLDGVSFGISELTFYIQTIVSREKEYNPVSYHNPVTREKNKAMQYSSLARLLLLLHAGRRYNCAASFVLPPGPAVGRDSVGTAGTRNICEREDSVVVDRKEEEKPFVRRDFEKNSPMDVIRPQASLSSSFYGPMPFGLVVGHTDSKEALVLAASNPQLGGVVLYGGKGTGKSVLARSVHRLLPPTIQRIKDSRYNVDPCDEKGEIDSILQAHLLAKSKSLQDLETESIPTPFVNVPLNCQEDSFLGTVDLEQSMISGQTGQYMRLT